MKLHPRNLIRSVRYGGGSRTRASVLGCCTALVLTTFLHASDDEHTFFESRVRPVLVEQCKGCHNAKKRAGGLRLDARTDLLVGGDSGPAIVPGDPERSLLIKAVRREGDFAMPPDHPLGSEQIAALAHWIQLGAAWPESNAPVASTAADDAARSHWAFQSVVRPQLPDTLHDPWVQTPVDAFVLARLHEHQLSPSPEADRRTLIRRVTYSLTGLPPSPEEVSHFIADTSPRAYERLVERLLDSRHYGEQWARHWLDVARYSDTKGYVYAREERTWVHAWAYRDWVVEALNKDMPYDRFLLLQLAADQVEDRQRGDLAAMGFLTLGRRFLGVRRLIVDDRIDVVTRATLGLTVSCARCHDHKYDPIPTADYYSLYGVFDSCVERLQPLKDRFGDEAFEQELRSRQAKLEEQLIEQQAAASNRARQRVGDYLFAQTELEQYPADGFDQIFEKDDLLPSFVRRWQRFLRTAERKQDPIFTLWHAYAELDPRHFAAEAPLVLKRLESAGKSVHPHVARAFATPPASFREVCDRYGELFAETRRAWEALLAESSAEDGRNPPTVLPDNDAESLRRLLYGPQAPCQVPAGPIVQNETLYDSAVCTQLWKLQGEVDRWVIQAKLEAPFALTLVDLDEPREPRIFRRGDPQRPGRDVPRQMLSLLSRGNPRQPFQKGSGRLELAQEIIDPANPLTARVIVNRVWSHHFGQGLVLTPSDFGTRAQPPSHPELLDWLASRFVAEGWSLKKLHQWIVLSATYRQTSATPASEGNPTRASQVDPGNRFLSRMNPHRLSFEEFRDSLLAATKQLNRSFGGKPQQLFERPFPRRRTLYGLVDRQYLPGTLRVFDFANPDLHTPRRNETTVPQQALFLLNHPLVLERATALAALARETNDPQEAVTGMFRQALQRAPTRAEILEAIELLHSIEQTVPAPPVTAKDWQYGYGTVDEPSQRVTDFQQLPHFTGDAWQGGAKLPDARLGWVQLTAAGGHPGNDLQRAAVRRWTAPRDMAISIRSHLSHQPKAGDGIRARVISSAQGVLRSAQVHHSETELNVGQLQVKAGETIDFVVDILNVLNSDQYLWEATLTSDSMTWNSRTDFPLRSAERLDPLEQLAHVILCTNEFLFVD